MLKEMVRTGPFRLVLLLCTAHRPLSTPPHPPTSTGPFSAPHAQRVPLCRSYPPHGLVGCDFLAALYVCICPPFVPTSMVVSPQPPFPISAVSQCHYPVSQVSRRRLLMLLSHSVCTGAWLTQGSPGILEAWRVVRPTAFASSRRRGLSRPPGRARPYISLTSLRVPVFDANFGDRRLGNLLCDDPSRDVRGFLSVGICPLTFFPLGLRGRRHPSHCFLAPGSLRLPLAPRSHREESLSPSPLHSHPCCRSRTVCKLYFAPLYPSLGHLPMAVAPPIVVIAAAVPSQTHGLPLSRKGTGHAYLCISRVFHKS
eukprot:EG_transcript_18988